MNEESIHYVTLLYSVCYCIYGTFKPDMQSIYFGVTDTKNYNNEMCPCPYISYVFSSVSWRYFCPVSITHNISKVNFILAWITYLTFCLSPFPRKLKCAISFHSHKYWQERPQFVSNRRVIINERYKYLICFRFACSYSRQRWSLRTNWK